MKAMITTKFLLFIVLAVIFIALLFYFLYLIKVGGMDLIERKMYLLKNLIIWNKNLNT